jgi:hypothetical protein
LKKRKREKGQGEIFKKAVPKIMKQSDDNEGMVISSQSVRNNIQAKKMRADIIKTMTKEELDQFRQEIQRSKLRPDSASSNSAMETLIC